MIDNFWKYHMIPPFIKRYKNLPGSPKADGNPLKWLKFLYHVLTVKPPQVPADFVLDRGVAMAEYEQLKSTDTLTWLGHAAFLFKLNGKTILLDPYLTDYASPIQGLGPKRFTPAGMAIADLPAIDIIAISHNHYDHLDAKTIEALPGKDKIQVIVPQGLGKFFKKYGYKNIHELGWYDAFTFSGITIRALPAYHFSKRRPFGTNTSLWVSYAMSCDNVKIFFSGDTAYGPVFKELGQNYGPFDYALLSIGAYQPQALMKSVHITPEEAVKIGGDLQAKVLVGMHWGTVILTEEPVFEPPERFKQAAIVAGMSAEDCWVLKIGETKKI